MSNSLKISDNLKSEVYKAEAQLVGLLWAHPELFSQFSEERLDKKHFGNNIWMFFFALGRLLAKKGLSILDDINAEAAVDEYGVRKQYEKYGGYATIEELMQEMKSKRDNLDGLYNEVKKYAMLRELRELFGEKVCEVNGKYDYKQMTAQEIHAYWMNTVLNVSMGDTGIDEQFLLEGLEEAIEEWDKNPDAGLPFFNSKYMTKICNGWALGCVYLFGGFGGKGKTSQTFNKVIMSCIHEKERLLVLANEQSLKDFQKMLLITAIGILDIPFNRQRLNEGNFTPEEKEALKKAIQLVKEWTDGDEKLITFVFLEDYNIDNLKNTIRHYATRGIQRVIIDTAKPTEGSSLERWQRFVEDFEQIYKLARPNGGGLNLSIWATVQLADHAIGKRFLDETALGDSKKIKNVCDVVFLCRSVFDDEYEGQSHEIEVYRWVNMGGDRLTKKTFKLKPQDGPYFLIFTSKNRRGQDNQTGLDVLVVKADFSKNKWIEVGWTKIFRDGY